MSGSEVQVEPDDLRRKAGQLDSLSWTDAQAPLAPPDLLPGSAVATANLHANASALWAHQQYGRTEGQRLAQTLRNVGGAYEVVDRSAGKDIASTMGGPAGPPAEETVYPQVVNMPAPPKPPAMSIPRGQPPPDPMLAPPQVQEALDAGDSGASLQAAAQLWRTNAQSLEASAQQFEVDSVLWEGEAADVAYGKFSSFRQWLIGLADNWKRLAGEADRIREAHERAQDQHRPVAVEYRDLEQQVMGQPMSPDTFPMMQRMAALQGESEVLRNVYARDSQPYQITPEDPPDPVVSGVPVTAEQHRRATGRLPQDDSGRTSGSPAGTPSAAGGGTPRTPQEPSPAPPTTQPSAPQVPQGEPAAAGPPEGGSPGGAPSGGSPPGGGSPGGGAPSGGAPGGGLPGGGSGGPKSDPRIPVDPAPRPAGAGGGGAGGGAGGGGIPSGPLQPAVGAETVAPTPVVAPIAPAAAAGGASGGVMGGGMGGMAPMMHGAQGNSGDKKRDPQLSEDEDLYTEDRPWTEPVIGNRPRRRGSVDEAKKESP